MNGVLVSSHICMTKDVGCQGNLFGGIMMSWLDEAGALAAMQYICSPSVVTLKVGETLFKKAVKAHDVVRIYSAIGKVGRTSLTIHLEARAVHLTNGSEEVVASTEMVFVKINGYGKATALFEDDHGVQRKPQTDGTKSDPPDDGKTYTHLYAPGTK